MRDKHMEYIVYKRFHGAGIDGEFNLRYGTIVTENGGFLIASDGSISGRTRRKVPSGRKCLNASINGMQSTAVVKTLRMKNGRGKKTATGKTGCVPQAQAG